MSKEKLEQALRNWQEKLANYEYELSITASPEKKFECRKKIEEYEQEIKRLTDSEHLQTKHPSASGIPNSVASQKPARSPPPWKLIPVIGLVVVVAIAGYIVITLLFSDRSILSKETEVDYKPLNRLLAKKTKEKWRKADEKTLELMLTAAGRESSDSLSPPSLEEFPCEDLKIIDRLWVKYSNGRFGFSVQNQI